jgi:hypothetical protein
MQSSGHDPYRATGPASGVIHALAIIYGTGVRETLCGLLINHEWRMCQEAVTCVPCLKKLARLT